MIHEIGHFKWSGFGKNKLHSPQFYKMLSDALTALGVPQDGRDTNDTDISGVRSPLSSPLGNMCGSF